MNRPTSDPEGKIAELERRLADDPTSTLFLPLGEAYRAAGRSTDAERTLRAGLDRHPDHGAARAALGRVLLESGRTDAAVLLLEAALAVAPDNVLARRLLDKVRAASPPDWRPAEPPAAEAGRVETTPSPTDELSTVTLAELYLQQGDRERALEIYREVAEREPNNPEWQERVRWLEEGRSLARGETPWPLAEAGAMEPGPSPDRLDGPRERRLAALRRFLGQVQRSQNSGPDPV